MYLQQRLEKIEQEINRFDNESVPYSTKGPALNLKGGLALPQMPTFNPSPIPLPSQLFMDQSGPGPNQFMPPSSSIGSGPPMPVPPPNSMAGPRLQFGAGPPPPSSSASSSSVLNFVPTQLQHRPQMRPAPSPMRGPGPGFGPGPSFQGPQHPGNRPPGPQFVPRSMSVRRQDDPKVVISAPPTKSIRPTQPSTTSTVVEPSQPVSTFAPPSVSTSNSLMQSFMSPAPVAFPRPAFVPPTLAGPMAGSSSFPLPVRPPEPGFTLSSASSASKAGPSTSASSSKGDAPKPKPKRVKPYLRVGGGKKWVDHTLSEWDSNDYRVFVGDLGHEVNDDMLYRSFVGYPSLQKARVIRDKITKKSRGYGFVSFKDGQDYLRAMREMNGKYCGNHPMKLRKSTWRERNDEVVKRKAKKRAKLGFKPVH